MSETDEKKATKLLEQLVELISQLNTLEKTFSRIKNESEELLRKFLKRKDDTLDENVESPKFDER